MRVGGTRERQPPVKSFPSGSARIPTSHLAIQQVFGNEAAESLDLIGDVGVGWRRHSAQQVEM